MPTPRPPPRPAPAGAQAVVVYLQNVGLAAEVYRDYDLETLEERLSQAVLTKNVGEYDGCNLGARETTLFLHGPDAELLFEIVHPVLKGYPLCQNARVLIRAGGPEVQGRELRVGA